MTDWLFPPAPAVSLPVVGLSARFPVRRILCVGQNYAAHAREMGHARAEPFFFTKPADAVVVDGTDPVFPMATADLHHEVELVCAVGSAGTIVGWAVGCDLTAAAIALSVNGALRQSGRLDDMIWSPNEILAKARELWDVRPGDLIFTGTPEGVGPLRPGDRVEATIEGLQTLSFTVLPR
jgi:fumarylpyruvate hydrolase